MIFILYKLLSKRRIKVSEAKNQEQKKSKVTVFTIFRFVKSKMHYVILSVILSTIAAIVSFVPYYSIFKIIENLLITYFHDTVIEADKLIDYGWLAFAGVVLNVLLYFAALMCSHLAAFGTIYNMKLDFATHLSRVPLGYHVLIGSGKLRKIMDDNIEKIEGFIAHQLPDIVAAIVSPIVAVIVLFIVDWRYGTICIIGILLTFVLQASMYGKEGAMGMMEEYQKYMEDMNNGAVEYVRGITVIKAFNQTLESFKALRTVIERATGATMEYTLKWKTSMSIFLTLIQNLYLFIVPLGIILMLNTQDYIKTLSVFIFYLLIIPAIGGILTKVMYVSMNSLRIVGGVERMMEVLNTQPLELTDTPKEIKNHTIEFENVHFSYNSESKALNGVSFIAKEGTVTALVGPSGGGKSTIAHLIPRFFDVSEGAIKVGGENIKNLDLEYLMDKVSFVFQDVFLFSQSIRENIRMGGKNATDEEVYNAAKSAMCLEFIEKLPNGFDTIIGQDGNYLSGGEMQRLAIARAIVKDAPIIVLDEATAFADPENEYLIQKALDVLLKDKTVIMIAHRLYTIKNADNIIVIADGLVKEQGDHSTLMNLEGLYHEMWKTYTRSSGWTMGKKGGAINA